MITELILAQRLMRGGNEDIDVEDDRGFRDAGLMAAMLGLEQHQALQRTLEGIGQVLKEQNDLLKGLADRKQIGQGGGLSSEMALEAFKTLDNDKDGLVTRAELDRHLGLAEQPTGLRQGAEAVAAGPQPSGGTRQA